MKKIKFLPKTTLGKWSVVLIIVMPVFFYVGMSFVDFYESVSAGKTILQDIIVRPGVALPMLAGMVSGISALSQDLYPPLEKGTCFIGLCGNHDRGITNFISFRGKYFFPIKQVLTASSPRS